MPLSKKRIIPGGETHYPWEREAIDCVLNALDDVDPYHAWPLHEFSDRGSGRLYEVDLLVLGKHALYLIEIKSHPGTLRTDPTDWYITDEAGRLKVIENPYSLTNKKAKALKSLLERHLPDNRFRVEPLVFVSHASWDPKASDLYGNEHVVTTEDVRRAITHGQWGRSDARGLPEGQRRFPVNKPLMKAVVQSLQRLGFRPSKASRVVGQYELGPLLSEGEGYQEHQAQHRTLEKAARVRSYLVPRATTTDRQEQLRRAAKREAQILITLGDHPGILSCTDFHEDAPLGPALLFERFSDALPLDSFLRAHPNLSFDQRLEIIRLMADAVGFCHKKGVLHRNLCPSSVLVRRTEDKIELRLHRFHLAHAEAHGGTQHLAAYLDLTSALYQAPEVLDDPSLASPASDVFGLGCLAYFVLTGQPPAATLPERELHLGRHGHLELRAVRDDFEKELAERVGFATELVVANRADDAIVWFNLVLDIATAAPEETGHPAKDPYFAQRGDMLDDVYLVKKQLGSGSSARVLEVELEGKSYALKVPHDESHVERLRAEAGLLGPLRHPHIVECHGMRTIGGRECLLLDFAAETTLAAQIRSVGLIGLDYAKRYGDDLLQAIQYLEERGLQHRDVKPANIGFTPSDKRAKHLILFDFSLADLDASQVMAGTPAYRDPFLRRRGRWDAAADRWSVAVTLYEMLTGALPLVEEDPKTGDKSVRLHADRFDPALRDRFRAFFERAFAPESKDRFATAEDMRLGAGSWSTLFDGRPDEPEPPSGPATFFPEGVTAATPVDALALTARARSALDRAGVLTVADLIQLPRNHLSAVRGVGKLVAQEIQGAADALRTHFSTDVGHFEPLQPRYDGPAVALGEGGPLGLDARQVLTLEDAGINHHRALAEAPRARVERLLGAELASALAERLLSERFGDAPATVSEWAAELLGTPQGRLSKPERQVRAYLGLGPLPGRDERPQEDGALRVPTAGEVAAAFGVTRATVLRSVALASAEWAASASVPALVRAAKDLLQTAGGALPLGEAASRLLDGAASDPRRPAAAALLRIVTELDSDETGGFVLGRVQGEPWLAHSDETLARVRALGAAADQLANERPLPSSETVQARLAELAAGTALARLPSAPLVQLAVRASEAAAASSRLEIYPRGMPADRALELASSGLALTELAPDELVRRVAARYPEAQPLPPRPDLDVVVERLGLVFVEDGKVYRRREALEPSTSATAKPVPRFDTAHQHQELRQTPAAQEARKFDDALRSAMERGRFRVIQTDSDRLEEAICAFEDGLGAERVSLDHQMWAAIQAIAARDGFHPDVVIHADRAGPEQSEDWTQLRGVVEEAARTVIDRILAERTKPKLVLHAGALARFGLAEPLQHLVERSDQDEGASVLLLLPAHRDGQAPSINNLLPVPTLPAQRLRLPEAWLQNEHRAPRPASLPTGYGLASSEARREPNASDGA